MKTSKRTVIGRPGKGSKRILVRAEFAVEFETFVTEAEFDKLGDGELDLDQLVDESEVYRLLATEDSSEYDWDLP